MLWRSPFSASSSDRGAITRWEVSARLLSSIKGLPTEALFHFIGGFYEHGAQIRGREYDPHAVEAKWRNAWQQMDVYRTPEPGEDKFYCLDFFPYPSGEGLTVGHGRNYVPTDIISRYKRMTGHSVLHPMGWDAFGLPAENEAIKKGSHPRETTTRYAANYKRQMNLLGLSYDWSREIFSSDPAYYKWTQWFFLLLYKRGLAYRAPAPVNWCETDQTVLANEEIEGGTCWRCHQPVVQRELTQWFFRITAYADRLREGLDHIDWPEHIVTLQRNWIGVLHDWLISRQRYWGTPIPIVYCPRCGEVPVPEDQLPVMLPHLPNYNSHEGARSPLARVPEFVNTTCPRCGGSAQRETDTMGGYACSSWYFLRFASPHYAEGPFDPEAVRRWLPVDLYVGGAEHAVSHLLYSRFWTKVMHDAGLIDFDEPFPVLRSQGALLADDGKRMAKSRPESVVSPEDVIARHGADATRLHTLFIAPFEASVVWSETGIVGVKRFLARVWSLACGVDKTAPEHADDQNLYRQIHRAVRDIGQGIEAFKLNTSVSALMEFSTVIEDHLHAHGPTPAMRQAVQTLVLLMAPFAPFLAEEAWERLGGTFSVHTQPWPKFDPTLAADETIEIIVQVNGKVRDRLRLPASAREEEIRTAALAAPGAQKHIAGKTIARTIYAPGRLINIVSK